MNQEVKTQYCRYCAHCIYGDVLYCTDHDEVMSDRKVRMVNHCKDFALSDMGDVFTGRPYTPRKGKPIEVDPIEEQIAMWPPPAEGEDIEELKRQARIFMAYAKEKRSER